LPLVAATAKQGARALRDEVRVHALAGVERPLAGCVNEEGLVTVRAGFPVVGG